MKLSISNIAWGYLDDKEMYQHLNNTGFDGIEIAPTRLVPDKPYDNIEQAIYITNKIKNDYNLNISSMQSIWFGRSERIFGTEEEREILIAYTEKAIKYAEAIGCKNIVFGCPKNRNMDDISRYSIALDFFSKLGKMAQAHGVVIAMEPNPIIYNTNFLNKTEEAIDFVKEINSSGLQVNLDLGTIIWNNEDINLLIDNIEWIHHIHISEPNLMQIEKRKLHNELKDILISKDYKGYVSIEMKSYNDVNVVKDTIDYVSGVMR